MAFTSPSGFSSRATAPAHRVLALTGATGLVGGAVLDAALRDGWTVRALRRGEVPEGAPRSARLSWVRGDLGDVAALDDLCDGASLIVHVAGAVAARDAAGFHAVNVAGAGRCAAAARRAGAARFVLVSSQAAREARLSAYANSKRLGEAAAARALGDVPLAIVRPPAVFGPGDAATEPIWAAIRKGVLPVPGGAGWRDRRFGAVTAAALAEAILRAPAGEVIEPSAYPSLSWADVRAAAGEAGHRVRLLPVPPALLRGAGRAADAIARLRGRAEVFGAGKVAEMLHPDWTARGPHLSAPTLAAAMRPLLGEGSVRKKVHHDETSTRDERDRPPAPGGTAQARHS